MEAPKSISLSDLGSEDAVIENLFDDIKTLSVKKDAKKPHFFLTFVGAEDIFLDRLSALIYSQQDLDATFCIDEMQFFGGPIEVPMEVIVLDHTSIYDREHDEAVKYLKNSSPFYRRLIVEVMTPQQKREVKDRVDLASRMRAIRIPTSDFYYLFVTNEDGSYDLDSDQGLLEKVRCFLEYLIRQLMNRSFTPLQESISELLLTMTNARESRPEISVHFKSVLDRFSSLPKYLGKKHAIVVLINGDRLPNDFSILDAAHHFVDLDAFGSDFNLNAHVLPKTPVLFISIGGDENSDCSSKWKNYCESTGHQFTVVAVANNEQVQVSDANRTVFDLFIDKLAAIHQQVESENDPVGH